MLYVRTCTLFYFICKDMLVTKIVKISRTTNKKSFISYQAFLKQDLVLERLNLLDINNSKVDMTWFNFKAYMYTFEKCWKIPSSKLYNTKTIGVFREALLIFIYPLLWNKLPVNTNKLYDKGIFIPAIFLPLEFIHS